MGAGRSIMFLAILSSLTMVGCPPPLGQVDSGGGGASGSVGILLAPADLSTEAVSSVAIRVHWRAVSDAGGYNVYRADAELGSYLRVNGAPVLRNQYVDSGLVADTTYWYKVVALRDGTEQTMSDPFSGFTSLMVPGNIVVHAVQPLQLEVGWDMVDGAEGYNLYRSGSSSAGFARINPSVIVDTVYDDDGLEIASSYWYKVVAVRAGLEQELSNPVGGVTMLGPPTIQGVDYLSNNSLRVGWDRLTGVGAYDVFRGDSQNGSFTHVNPAPVLQTTYVDSGLAQDRLYWYRVAAERDGVAQMMSEARRGLTANGWAKSYGGTEIETATSVRQTSDGGYIVAGKSDSFAYYHGTCWVTKSDRTGSVQWQKYYENCVGFSDIRQTADGGYVLGSRCTDMWRAGDFIVLKLDSGGRVAWSKKIGSSSPADETLTCIEQTSDGGYVLGGTTNYAVFIVKLTSSGARSWARTYYGPTFVYVNSVRQTADGGFIAGASTRVDGTSGSSCWILKLTSTGDVSWSKAYLGPSIYGTPDLEQTSDGGYIVGAHSSGFWIMKLAADGSPTWQKSSGVGNGVSLQQTTDGGFVVGGTTSAYGSGMSDLWVWKLDANGGVSWQQTIGGSRNDALANLRQTSDGGYVAIGSTESFTAGKSDIWVVRLPSFGTLPGAEILTSTAVPFSDTTVTVTDLAASPTTPSLLVTDTTAYVYDTDCTTMTQYP